MSVCTGSQLLLVVWVSGLGVRGPRLLRPRPLPPKAMQLLIGHELGGFQNVDYAGERNDEGDLATCGIGVSA